MDDQVLCIHTCGHYFIYIISAVNLFSEEQIHVFYFDAFEKFLGNSKMYDIWVINYDSLKIYEPYQNIAYHVSQRENYMLHI